MAMKGHSQKRVADLQAAIALYEKNTTTSTIFQPNHITNIPNQTKMRNDPKVLADLHQLDTEMMQLEAMREQLEETHVKLRVWRAKSKNMLTPIFMLPDEILGHIFTCSLPIGRELVEWSMAISTVCSRWRKIAISYRVLWNIFDVRWHAYKEEQWLKRANGLPLSIYVDFPGPHGEDHLLSAIDFRGLLRQDGIFALHDSWHSVDVSIAGQLHHLTPIIGFLEESCPKLRRLTIIDSSFGEGYRNQWELFDMDLFRTFSHKPELDELVIRSIYPINLYAIIAQLRVLRINTVGARSSARGSVRRWMDLLARATQLQELEADWDRMSWRKHGASLHPMDIPTVRLEPQYQQPVHSHSLTALKLRCADFRVCEYLFRHIRIPNLETLSMDFDPATFNFRTVGLWPPFMESLQIFFRGMPSVRHASFKALPEVLFDIVSCLAAPARLAVDTVPTLPEESGTAMVALTSVRHLTLRSYLGAFINDVEMSPSERIILNNKLGINLLHTHRGRTEVVRLQRRHIWSVLDQVCRGRAREKLGRPVYMGPDAAVTKSVGELNRRPFHRIELLGLPVAAHERRALEKYTRELIIDDPYDDLEDYGSASRPFGASEPPGSSIAGDDWEPGSDHFSEANSSQRWHSSDEAYTDEEQIENESESSYDENALDSDSDGSDNSDDDDEDGDPGYNVDDLWDAYEEMAFGLGEVPSDYLESGAEGDSEDDGSDADQI
ncbi:hypothetical protein DL93DRAFT_2096144 [Clavulina sp. PMI_390]|nr:hypothetical protein DL93DRAFT_2096144 [Clavulina sp. PMI_390]